MNRRSAVLFFVLPFLGVFVFLSLATYLQHRDLKARTGALVRSQLAATAAILGRSVSRSLDGGASPAAALDEVLAEEEVYFVALLGEGREVLAWNSRFEGYLPLSLQGGDGRGPEVIESPAGQIFSERVDVRTADGRRFGLFLGYAMTGMEEMVARSGRASLVVLMVVLAAGALFFRGLYRIQSRFLAKAREAESERREKEHFRDISAFTSGVAHEIKNPLNSLALVFELLGRKVPAAAQSDLDLGKAQVRTIGRIVDRFARVVKAVRPEVGPATLDALVKQAVDGLSAEDPTASARVRTEVPPGLALNVDGDLLTQALLNILKNAVEAAPAAEIRVAGRRSGPWIEVTIDDRGPGFPPGAAARLFEPFYSTKDKGMGIGLYLAKRTVEAHGGTIEARDREGGGAEFRILLPGA